MDKERLWKRVRSCMGLSGAVLAVVMLVGFGVYLILGGKALEGLALLSVGLVLGSGLFAAIVTAYEAVREGERK